jgi:deoxyhypusine synthase
MNVSEFIQHHFRHFNAAALVDAADAYSAHMDRGGKMLVTLAGAMSTAELGISLAEMIRQGKVDAISCTGANLEEDIFNLMAHKHYVRLPNYRDLSPADEKSLEDRGLNRVTDTCIPEEQAFRAIEKHIVSLWERADQKGERYFPHEFMYQLLREKLKAKDYQIPAKDSWLLAACERDLPIFVPGWEDSTLGNIFVSHVRSGDVKNYTTVRSGLEYMGRLIDWYIENSAGAPTPGLSGPSAHKAAGKGPGKSKAGATPTKAGAKGASREISAKSAHSSRAAKAVKTGTAAKGQFPGVGFFQIGGGIAGDFPICVVPLIHQDMGIHCPYWGYFCQISDSTTSYGSYSGAVPNEKISWGKLAIDTPKFVIESDASIVAPLIFARVLGW